jgi:hypothetical protein
VSPTLPALPLRPFPPLPPLALPVAPDRGAALFEALLHAAARLGDLVLIRALLAAAAAAGAPLSSPAHRAVLHALGKAGRHDEALDRLLHVVPRHLLSSHHVLAVVRPAAAAGARREVGEALRLAQQVSLCGAYRGVGKGTRGCCHARSLLSLGLAIARGCSCTDDVGTGGGKRRGKGRGRGRGRGGGRGGASRR